MSAEVTELDAQEPPVAPVEAPSPSASEDDRYVILMETNGEECESWYYFIKYAGNEEALKYLQTQLEKIEMYVVDEYSTFDLDLEHFVSEKTAKEMTLVELNSVTFHRKFDGKMDNINLGLKKKDSNEKRIKRTHEKLAMGRIEDYVEDEDAEEEEDGSVSSESEHEDDEDLIPVPVSVARGQAILKSGGLSTMQRASAKKRRGRQ